MSGKRKKRADGNAPDSNLVVPDKRIVVPSSTFRLADKLGSHALAGSTHLMAISQKMAVINPPPRGGDRTKPDRDRFKDRMKGKIKGKLTDILTDNPIFGDKGRVRIPVDGGKEPRWRPGRDGSGGGGRGRKGSNDKGNLIYIEVSIEEFLELLFQDFPELPFLLKKDVSTMLVKTHKLRGLQPNGPWARVDWEATAIARMERAVAMKNANPEEFPGLGEDEIPDEDLVPYEQIDLRYRRVEEKWEPDSKAVAFLVLDRSGSMGGEPLAIAKLFFLLNVLYLRSKYKTVAVEMIAHDGQAYHIKDEREFYQIEVDGGTLFVPAYEMTWDIAQREYPAGTWNRYIFQATDGYMFDPGEEITQWAEKFIRGLFNYFGYLEIDPYQGRGRRDWYPGGEALLNVADDVEPHIGMAKVASKDEVLEAFKSILSKDKEA